MPEIQFPITVNAIHMANEPPIKPPPYGGKTGDFVSIRPVGEEHKGKTYLGVLIGDVALQTAASFNRETGRLTVSSAFYNPAILVPSLGKVIYGTESWWGVIRTPDQLRAITDQDIDSVWYVQALKKLTEDEAKEQANV